MPACFQRRRATGRYRAEDGGCRAVCFWAAAAGSAAGAIQGNRQERLERVIAEWLQLERERQPFTVIQQEARRRVTVGGIDLSIRADRMDRLENGDSVVLDYKTGECSASDWFGSRPNDPQLPIYAVTAEAPSPACSTDSSRPGRWHSADDGF